MNDYYVYAWLDPRKKGKFIYDELFEFDYEPFYIGKGSNGRYKDIQGRNYPVLNKIAKIKKETGNDFIILKIIEEINEQEAHDFEKELIKLIGRKDKREGILLNLTDGGEGVSGQIYTEEYKRKLSLAHKGHVPWNKGKKASLESRLKSSESHKGKESGMKGKKHSLATKKKMSTSWTYEKHKEGLIKASVISSINQKGKPLAKATKDRISKTLRENPPSKARIAYYNFLKERSSRNETNRDSK